MHANRKQCKLMSRVSWLFCTRTKRLCDRRDVDMQVVRGTPAAPLAQLLRAAGPALRNAAGLGAWELAARPPAGSLPVTGRLVLVDSLGSAPPSGYREPTALLLDCVGGEEDVPQVLLLAVLLESQANLQEMPLKATTKLLSGYCSECMLYLITYNLRNKLLSARELRRVAWQLLQRRRRTC